MLVQEGGCSWNGMSQSYKKYRRPEQEEAGGAHAPEASTRLELSTPIVLYPKQYAADSERIQIKQDAEDHGITKPSRNEKLFAGRSNAFERGETVAAASVNTTIDQRQANCRTARNRKRADITAVLNPSAL